MRVNPNFVPNVLNAISQTQMASDTALLQMSSGKRVNVPSDDPAATATMVQLTAHADQVDQYTGNITTIQNLMQAADSALSTITSELNQAISAGVQGANSTMTSANRLALAQQVQGILTSVVSQANLSYSGAFVFGGTKSTTQPFSADGTAPSGYVYNGNSGVNMVPVGDGLNIQANLPGDQIFQNPGASVLGSLQKLITSLQSGSASDIGDATTAIRGALDYVSQQRVFYGNNLNQLGQQETYLKSETVTLKSQEDTLVAADLSQVATEFTQAQTAHSATLAAAARLFQNTLLDYLK